MQRERTPRRGRHRFGSGKGGKYRVSVRRLHTMTESTVVMIMLCKRLKARELPGFGHRDRICGTWKAYLRWKTRGFLESRERGISLRRA